jgi:hypothetical protein
MALSRFKYVGGKDTGVNPEKSRTLYGFVFPLGKDVEVPDDVAHKLRTKAGRDGDEFVEVKVGADKNEAELQQEKDAKLLAKSKTKDVKLTPEEIEELKEVQKREQARTDKIRADAQLGR